jgi:hypothetical protein
MRGGCGEEERVAAAGGTEGWVAGSGTGLGRLRAGAHGRGEVGGELGGEDCGGGGGDDVAGLDGCYEGFAEAFGIVG